MCRPTGGKRRHAQENEAMNPLAHRRRDEVQHQSIWVAHGRGRDEIDGRHVLQRSIPCGRAAPVERGDVVTGRRAVGHACSLQLRHQAPASFARSSGHQDRAGHDAAPPSGLPNVAVDTSRPPARLSTSFCTARQAIATASRTVTSGNPIGPEATNTTVLVDGGCSIAPALRRSREISAQPTLLIELEERLDGRRREHEQRWSYARHQSISARRFAARAAPSVSTSR
jgi:hypothetical protein